MSAEPYVEHTVNVVRQECLARKINELEFWEWLGNVRFPEDGWSLSPERAMVILRDVKLLLREYGKVGGRARPNLKGE